MRIYLGTKPATGTGRKTTSALALVALAKWTPLEKIQPSQIDTSLITSMFQLFKTCTITVCLSTFFQMVNHSSYLRV